MGEGSADGDRADAQSPLSSWSVVERVALIATYRRIVLHRLRSRPQLGRGQQSMQDRADSPAHPVLGSGLVDNVFCSLQFFVEFALDTLDVLGVVGDPVVDGGLVALGRVDEGE